MAYLALARKYRPEKFTDLVGQDATAVALANAIKLGREPAAVIFSGVRGVGKTTMARLYAKALNCDQGPTPTPCGTCTSCINISIGCHEDVLEIDGASNNGVDEIRSLKETTAYVPQRSRFKVYIVDEVHMLSTSAFNALLKILEEPPQRVVFVFATTELNKVPQTVLSRCQVFYLQKLNLEQTFARLCEVLRQENIAFEERAVYVVAREGRGSLRDALTFLDQIIALGDGKVTWQALSQVLGNLTSVPFLKLLQALVECDAKLCLAVVDRLDQRGIDFSTVPLETAKLARHGLIYKQLGDEGLGKASLALADEEMRALKGVVARTDERSLLRLFRFLVQCQRELDGSSLDRFVIENYCFEWCFSRGQAGVDEQAPAQKTVDPAPSSHVVAPAPASPAPASINAAPLAQSTQAVKPAPQLGLPGSWRDLLNAWKQRQPMQARKLEEVHPVEYGPLRIVVAVDADGFMGPTLLQTETQIKIAKQLHEFFGFAGEFKAIRKQQSGGNAQPHAPSVLEQRAQEQASKQEQILAAAYNHPATKAVIESLQGRVVKAEVLQ